MRAISEDTRNDLFKDSTTATKYPGYVVYEPLTVVEITQERPCETKDASGKCTAYGASRCKVGTPFYVPNYSRPTLINSRTGFGKAGVDVTISNGWQLGAVKDNTDSSAVLSLIEKVAGLSTAAIVPGLSPSAVGCTKEGLYVFELQGTQVKLSPIQDYSP
jgi:hypothetical protein